MSGAGLAALALALLAFAAACVVLERRGRGVVVVLCVLGLVVVDAALYADTEAASLVSLLHPTVAGQSLRLTQVVIPIAVLARLVVRGRPRVVTDPALALWVALGAWVLVCVGAGLAGGHPAAVVLGEGAVVVHLGGALALAATVPARDYVTGTAVPRFLQAAAALAAVLFVIDTAGVRTTGEPLPDLPVLELGQYGADAASVFGVLGVVGLLTELCRPRSLPRRVSVLLPSAVLLVSHLAVPQRAARLGLYVTLLLVLVVAASPTARRRLRVAAREVAVGAACLAAVVLAAVLLTGVRSALPAEQDTRVVSAMDTDSSVGGFGIQTRRGSIDSRFFQWEVVAGLVADRPVLGHGLGARFVYYEVGDRAFVRSNITHNIALDLLLRTGLAGLLLFAGAVGVTLAGGLAVWRRSASPALAGLALAAGTSVVGLLAKGMVESVFDKYRLAVLLGLLLGMLLAARRGLDEEAAAPVTPRRERAPLGV